MKITIDIPSAMIDELTRAIATAVSKELEGKLPSSNSSFLGQRFVLTVSQAAERLGLSRRTLDNWRADGGGPAFLKYGSRVVYDINDLEKFTAAAKRQSTTEGRL
jgi:hypothetical protein